MKAIRLGLALTLLAALLVVFGLRQVSVQRPIGRQVVAPVVTVAWWGVLFGPVGFENVATRVIVPGQPAEGPLLLTEQELRELPTRARSAVADWLKELFS